MEAAQKGLMNVLRFHGQLMLELERGGLVTF
jgi:hypothetical protein